MKKQFIEKSKNRSKVVISPIHKRQDAQTCNSGRKVAVTSTLSKLHRNEDK